MFDLVKDFCFLEEEGPVVGSLVSANRWLRGVKTCRFPWYLTLDSANHASSNPGQAFFPLHQRPRAFQ